MDLRKAALVVMMAALAAGCGRGGKNARVDAAIAPLIPSDTVVLAGLRLDRLKDTPFFKTYVEGHKIKVLDDFQAKTGIDPTRDIWELVYAGNTKRSMVFIRGKFGGQFGLEPDFRIPGVERQSYKTYYILSQGEAGVMFVTSGVAVAGAVKDLKSIIDNRDKSGESPPNDLIEMVTELPLDHAWLVSLRGGAMVPDVPMKGNMANFARLATSLGEVKLHADLSSGVNLQAEAEYPDASLAKQVQDTIRAGVGILRLRTPDTEKDLMRIYDGIQVNAKDKQLLISVVTPFEVIDQAAKLFSTRRPEGAKAD
ncbi:hypothetical protein [uncultured Paludibaculum sp.]|uniref:hypothetical protein n=1 Tax=uncultured Paludibaculum sp. TaxID=1765020 RepID=UPI002AAAC15D|nr:hypothetical protein [uncultured Paludibaculum sp.]